MQQKPVCGSVTFCYSSEVIERIERSLKYRNTFKMHDILPISQTGREKPDEKLSRAFS
jgi:hypothetical protein